MTTTEIISDNSLPQILAIEIICGDCAGDGLSPQTTYQTVDARCAGCGGRSFVPASSIKKQPAKKQSRKNK
jgi:hypothetical protein